MLHVSMKPLYALIALSLLTTQFTYCQQNWEQYEQNYGLFSNPYNFPNYSISTNALGYRVDEANVKQTSTGLQIPIISNGNASFFGRVIQDLVVDVEYETSERVHVKIYDKSGKQLPVPNSPLGLERPKTSSIGHRDINKQIPGSDYQFKYSTNPFSFQITRKSDSSTLFNSTDFPLVFEDQYLEISTHLPENNTNIFGLGETIAPFKRGTNVTTLFPRDAHVKYQNMYGAHPFYIELHNDGAAHGTLLLNAHPMDIIKQGNQITYKAIGGVLDFYFFVPKDKMPNSVVQAYTELVGKPMMPAHWMLGYQNCRYGYRNIAQVEEVVNKHKKAGIPLEVQWIDIDYMDKRKDFTFDPVNFPQDKVVAFSNKLLENGQGLVLMVDPAIAVNETYEPYTRGRDLDVFVKNVDGSEFVGQVWSGYSVFPDWWHPNISDYWEKEISDWIELTKAKGLWIDMNEPASFCLGSCGSLNMSGEPAAEPWKSSQEEQIRLHNLQEAALNAMGHPEGETRNLLYPGYTINNGYGNLSEKTVAMTAQHYGNVSHYDLHNIYGHAEGYITKQAILKHNNATRPFLLSRSSFVGSGSYMGHWTGDIQSTWDDFKTSIASVLSFQMFGISYVGADICGFQLDATEELCTRWMELGAFYVFSRNHNSDEATDQEPYLWNSTTEASRIALAVRYALLPYFYTLSEESSRLGTGIWRPLVFEYPQYVNDLADNDVQFLIGTDILVSPVVEEGAIAVNAQFPPGIWFDWYDYTVVANGSEDQVYSRVLDAPLLHIPVHIRGGAVVPTKTPKLLVKDTYATFYNLIIALDENKQAHGRLYIDDGYSVTPPHSSNVNFIFVGDKLIVNGQFDYPEAEAIGNITILSKERFYGIATTTNQTFVLLNCTTTAAVLQANGSLSLKKGFTIEFHGEQVLV